MLEALLESKPKVQTFKEATNFERGARPTGITAQTAPSVLQTAAHRLTCPCARNSAMSALHVGQGLTTLRTRIVRPALAARSSGSPRPCYIGGLCNAA